MLHIFICDLSVHLLLWTNNAAVLKDVVKTTNKHELASSFIMIFKFSIKFNISDSRE